MKIAYMVQYYPPHTGGLEQVAQKQAESAVAAGHEVSVVTFALPNVPAGVTNEQGILVHRVRGNHFFDTHLGIPFCLGGSDLWRTMMREVRSADIVHMHDVFYPTSHVGYLAARRYKKPIILTQHVAIVAHTSVLVTLLEKIVYGWWGKLIFRASEHIITYQTVVRDFLLAQGVSRERILEVHNGIELSVFTRLDETEKLIRRRELGLPTDRPLVLFVGRLVPKKGYKELYDARDPAYDLVFVGPGDVPDEWYRTEGVHVLGPRTQAELMYLYPTMDVFAAPSRGEMFTLVMQEAFASSLPVVTTNAPQYAAYALDRARIALCEPSAPVLKQELTRITEDKELQNNMATYSRTLAERYFNWHTNVQPVLDLYAQLHRTT